MATSKTFHVQRSGGSAGLSSLGGGLQAGSQGRSQNHRQDSGWAALARWLLAVLVALGLSVQVEAREAQAVKADTVVAVAADAGLVEAGVSLHGVAPAPGSRVNAA